jgi:formylglycine-generating enzyme required for sulfatase activity
MFCQWVGGRLPTESEWEYAARSEGQNQKFPWGNDKPGCESAVVSGAKGPGCQEGSYNYYAQQKVCSRPEGNTAQGLCDMIGNADEWVSDKYHENYTGAPTNYQAWLKDPFKGSLNRELGIVRGGNFITIQNYAHAYIRAACSMGNGDLTTGFRCVRDIE